MTDTLHLALPLIAAAQAQKHVTHNEALRSLDAIVMLSVIDRDLTAPPGSPADGARYLVKATGTGAFAGKDGQIAHFRDGAWAFHMPRAGWIAHVADEGALLVHDGSIWQPLLGATPVLQNVSWLGLATNADATNPLSAVLNNALFAARTAANGGDGDLRYKLSKESASDTASLLLQHNFSGRAEIGLTGDDDLHLKVSSDGTTWRDGLVIAAATGKVSFPQGATGLREKLAANRTYYVRTDGSDSNDGLTNTSGGAFLTIQKAINTVAALDISTYGVTIQVADGTYSASVSVSGPWIGTGTVTLSGNGTTPGNCVMGGGLTVQNGGKINVSGFKLQYLYSRWSGYIGVAGKLDFASTVGAYHIYAESYGIIEASGGMTFNISGASAYCFALANGGFVNLGGLILTTSGTVAYSIFAVATRQGIISIASATFTGATITGSRYSIDTGGLIYVAGGGASYLPGNSSGSGGTTSGGGFYV